MINYLKVSNFALIDKLEVDFTSGFNVLTGETGAGKSIIIKAIELLLGERASSEVIREGASSSEIQASFTIKPEIIVILKQHDLPIDENNLIVRRLISSSGSKNFINGSLVNLQTLKNVMTQIINICGQHEHQLLIDPDEQLKLVDNFGSHQSELLKIKETFNQIKQIKKQIEDLSMDENSKEREIDYLEYQLSEIDEVSPSLNEEEELQNKEQKILGMKDLKELCSFAESCFYGEDQSVISSLESLLMKLKSGLKHDPALEEINEKLNNVIGDLEELASYFTKYFKKNNLDEDDLDYIISRLENFKKLKRKYGGSIASVLEKRNKLKEELDKLQSSDQVILDLEKEKKTLIAQYNKLAEVIHKERVKVAEVISTKVTKELQELKMSGSVFKINIQSLTQLTSKGKDAVVFMIAPNKGEGLKPLEKIASGGELSRIMLALTKVITEKNTISLYIFDEIDAGIGGETGLVVGEKLKQISTNQQTICITHLPQVAVFASNHLVISKSEKNNRTQSTISPLLKEDQKVLEIARMLGGNMVEKAKDHAQDMINKAKSL